MELFQRNRIWWCTFYVDGVRHRSSTKQRTKSAAKTIADQILQRAHGGETFHRSTGGHTLTAYAPIFLQHISRTQLDSDTKRYYANGVRLLLQTELRGKRLDRISSSECSATHFPGSGSNANCALRTLRRALSLAADQRLIPAPPRIYLRKENERTAIISSELEREILAFAREPFRDSFLIMQDSGMRPDEVIRLRWDDVLWGASLLYVREGKTAKATRHVPLSDRVRAVLRVRANGSTSEWVFPSIRRRKDGNRSHIRAFGLSKEWSRLRKLLNIPKELVPYSARHTFGTDLMNRVNGNIVLVSDVLGHADIKITRRYIHPSTQGLARLIDERNAAKTDSHKLGHRQYLEQ